MFVARVNQQICNSNYKKDVLGVILHKVFVLCMFL